MRTKVFSLGLSKKLAVAGMITMLLSVSLLSTLTEHVLAAPDKFGIEQLYSTADGGPVWFLNNEEPEEDEDFLVTSANDIELEEEEGSDVFELDA
jgi:hypothetical protein